MCCGGSYLNAGIYGTDEENVGEDDEDTDVDPQHDWGAAGGDTQTGGLRKVSVNVYVCVCACVSVCHSLWKYDNLDEGDETEDQESTSYVTPKAIVHLLRILPERRIKTHLKTDSAKSISRL